MSAPSDGARADARKARAAAEVSIALWDADHCHGIVTRGGIEDACGKPPVALIDNRNTEDNCIWPACAYHANRYGAGRCVPLADLAAALAEVSR